MTTRILILLAWILFLSWIYPAHSQTITKAHISVLTKRLCHDPSLAMAIIQVETNFRNVASEEGSIGLMQVRPSTAEWIGCEAKTKEQLMIPELNIKCGCKYLKQLSQQFNKQTDVIASYNAGSPRLCRTGVLKPSGKKCVKGSLINQYYVERVLSVLVVDALRGMKWEEKD